MRQLDRHAERLWAWAWRDRPPAARERVSALVAVAALTAWLLPIALQHLIDGDEGYLLMAARLIAQGSLPYRDFFLPQAPLLPACFGLIFTVSRGWMVARLFAGAIAVAIGYLVYRETLAVTRRTAAAWFAAALFACASGTVGWLTIVKGYGLALLFLLLAVRLLGSLPTPTKPSRRASLIALGAGLALGLAASTRLYTAAIIPVLAIHLIVRVGRNRTALRLLASYLVGGAVGALPLLVGCLVDAKAFVFDVLLFHGVREYGQDSLFGTAEAKLPAVLKSLGFHPDAAYGDRQLMAMLLAALLGAIVQLRRPASPSAARWAWPALLLASVLPNPFQRQYFCMLVPFLAIETGRLLATLQAWARERSAAWTRALGAGTAVYLAYNLVIGAVEYRRYVHTGRGIPGVWLEERAVRWRIATVEAVATAIDLQRLPEAASWWPGYLVGARTPIVVELANDFGLRAGEALSADERRRYHVVRHDEVGAMIRQRQPRLFVAGNWATLPWSSWLPGYGYELRATVENAQVWVADQRRR
jgi:hypothetical protein